MHNGEARGRPRDPRIDKAVLNAAAAVFRERGFHSASIMEIARRAGVGTPAVYRRWPSKEQLAADLVIGAVSPSLPDTGNLRRDLTEFLRERFAMYTDTMYLHLVLTLLAFAAVNRADAAFVARGYEVTRAPLQARLQIALDRGELAPGTDIRLIGDLVSGAVHIPFMYTGIPRRPRDYDRVIAGILDGVAHSPRNA